MTVCRPRRIFTLSIASIYSLRRVLTSMMNSASRGSLGDSGPGASPLSGRTLSYWEERNLRARLTKFPKLFSGQCQFKQDYFDITFSGGRYCWQRSIKQRRRSVLSDMQDADLSHNPPRRTWHQKFPDAWREGSTAIRKQEFRSL